MTQLFPPVVAIASQQMRSMGFMQSGPADDVALMTPSDPFEEDHITPKIASHFRSFPSGGRTRATREKERADEVEVGELV